MSNNQGSQNQPNQKIPYYPPPNPKRKGVEVYKLAYKRPPGSGNGPVNAWEINASDCYWVRDDEGSARETELKARAQKHGDNQGGADAQGPAKKGPKN